jgi:hypothetical protein
MSQKLPVTQPIDMQRVPTLHKVVKPEDLDPASLNRLMLSGITEQEKNALIAKLTQSLKPGLEQWLELTVRRSVNEILNPLERK